MDQQENSKSNLLSSAISIAVSVAMIVIGIQVNHKYVIFPYEGPP